MGLLFNFKGIIRKESESSRSQVHKKSEVLITIIQESIEIAKVNPNLEIKKARLDFAMKKVIELISMANRHPYIESKKLGSIYASIREVRNDIKALESVMVPFSKREVA